MSLYFRVVTKDSDSRLHDVQVLLDMRRLEMNKGLKIRPGRELAWIQPHYFYVIAYSHEGPIGFVHVEQAERSRQKLLNMHEFYTLPAQRHQDVAKKLLVYLGSVADKRGISKMSIPNYTHRMKGVVEWATQGERVYYRRGKQPTFSEGAAHVIGENAIIIYRKTRTRFNRKRVSRPHA